MKVLVAATLLLMVAEPALPAKLAGRPEMNKDPFAEVDVACKAKAGGNIKSAEGRKTYESCVTYQGYKDRLKK